MLTLLLGRLAATFLDKKRIIGWISAVIFVIGAGIASMNTQEFKSAVCQGAVIDAPSEPH